jgi:hypothetical protein
MQNDSSSQHLVVTEPVEKQGMSLINFKLWEDGQLQLVISGVQRSLGRG